MSGTLDYHLKHQDFKCQGACTPDADRLMMHNAVWVTNRAPLCSVFIR